jgi:transcriptional regulator with XRE-family HTH domain
MTFGKRILELRTAKNLTQREVADKIGINFTYLSKIENDKLQQDTFPGEDTIKKLAEALGANEDELLLLAQRIPDSIRQRVIQRPDAFRKVASLDDETLNKLLGEIEE